MRLIDADALIKVIQQNDYMLTAKHNSMAPGMFTSGIRQAVDEAPTANPVKHGRWVEAMQGEMHLYPDGQKMCNVCHTIMPSTWKTMPPFCFGCGAKMAGEV